MAQAPDEVREAIETDREQLGETVRALAAKADVKARVQPQALRAQGASPPSRGRSPIDRHRPVSRIRCFWSKARRKSNHAAITTAGTRGRPDTRLWRRAAPKTPPLSRTSAPFVWHGTPLSSSSVSDADGVGRNPTGHVDEGRRSFNALEASECEKREAIRGLEGQGDVQAARRPYRQLSQCLAQWREEVRIRWEFKAGRHHSGTQSRRPQGWPGVREVFLGPASRQSPRD